MVIYNVNMTLDLGYTAVKYTHIEAINTHNLDHSML